MPFFTAQTGSYCCVQTVGIGLGDLPINICAEAGAAANKKTEPTTARPTKRRIASSPVIRAEIYHRTDRAGGAVFAAGRAHADITLSKNVNHSVVRVVAGRLTAMLSF